MFHPFLFFAPVKAKILPLVKLRFVARRLVSLACARVQKYWLRTTTFCWTLLKSCGAVHSVWLLSEITPYKLLVGDART